MNMNKEDYESKGFAYNQGVSVIIPAKNEAAYIGKCIDSIRRQSFNGFLEIIVVNNQSSDETYQIAHSKGVKVLGSDAKSPSAVRNAGAREARFSLIAFIDGDCVAPPQWLENAVHYLNANPLTGAFGGTCLIPPDANWVVRSWAPGYNKDNIQKAVTRNKSLPGANFITRHELFRKIGGFDETLITGEDDEICERIKRSGFEVISSVKSPVIHYGYPDSLRKVFGKSIWHSKTMISALALWKNKVLLLTLAWLASLFLVFLSIVEGSFFLLNLGVLWFLINPALLAFSRIKNLESSQKIRIFGFTYIVSVFVLSGLAVGFLFSLFSALLIFLERKSNRKSILL